MTQVTPTKLDKLNTFELYKHHAALTSSLSLLTPESKELALAELESCARLRSSKLDGIHYHLTQHQKMVEVGKEEKKLLDAAIKHHEAEIAALKSILMEVRRRGYADGNKIMGSKYTYSVIPNPKPTVEISSDLSEWCPEDLSKYAMVEEVIKTTIYKSTDGNNIIRTDEKVTARQIPNTEAIIDSHEKGHQLPTGVRVIQNYQVRTKRNINHEE
tara:strand:- start:3139 stop:3783 length:645 start_codon:yes stop_codon:yes gene_type:complete